MKFTLKTQHWNNKEPEKRLGLVNYHIATITLITAFLLMNLWTLTWATITYCYLTDIIMLLSYNKWKKQEKDMITKEERNGPNRKTKDD